MTAATHIEHPDLDRLRAGARAAGLRILAEAGWPESPADDEVPALGGYVESTFSPLVAQVTARVLGRRDPAPAGAVTAMVIVTALGDVTSATRVAQAVDAGTRIHPLLFYQSVPNSIAGYLTARWQLTGPVACVSGTSAGFAVAATQIHDGDADEALIVSVDMAVTDGVRDRAAGLLVTGPIRPGIPGS